MRKTIYAINHQGSSRTLITLDKWCADTLQENIKDVHGFLEILYRATSKIHPELPKRRICIKVKNLAETKAFDFVVI